MMQYPIKLTRDTNGQYLVTFPDVPEAITAGDTLEEARQHAIEALETALDFYFEDRREVPAPSRPKRGQQTVALPTLAAAKVLLHNEMVSQNVRKAELARRLHIAAPNVERIFKLKHGTKIETIEAALAVLGKHLEVRVG
jgi:antitoxin HicB